MIVAQWLQQKDTKVLEDTCEHAVRKSFSCCFQSWQTNQIPTVEGRPTLNI